jgi:DNA ligase-associated metallophosphoesterase
MKSPIPHKILEQQFWLTTDRTMFWEEEKSLIVSDLHFGKTGHFRKSVIAVPQSVYKEELQRLVAQIQFFQPKQLIIVGDLFHSHANKELELFRKWRENFPDLTIHLIKGNHDILEDEWYKAAAIQVSHPGLDKTHFHFIHDIETCPEIEYKDRKKSQLSQSIIFQAIFIPGVRIHGAGRQSLCFPCFYFGLPMLYCLH